MHKMLVYFSVLIWWMSWVGLTPDKANGELPKDGLDAHFYLSTEKSFTPQDNARIKIEHRRLPAVTVRLYRVPQPEELVKARKNINRVYIESEYIQRNPTELLVKFFHELKYAFRLHAHQRVPNPDTRAIARDRTEGFLYREPARRAAYVGKLHDYEWLREFPLTLDFQNSWTYQSIEFGQLASGLYLVEVYSPSLVGYTLLHVSETTLIIKQADNHLLIRVVDKLVGSSTTADVTVYDFTTGKLVGKGTTTAGGIFNLDFPRNQYQELMVCSAAPQGAEAESDFTFYKLDLYPSTETERMVYLYTDGPIYRPGDAVQIKGIIRDYTNSVYQLPGAQTVSMSVIDPRGNRTELADATVSAYGTFVGAFQTQDNFPTGMYTILAKVGDKSYKGEFRLEHYLAPVFKVNVTVAETLVIGDKTVPFRISAKYFTGNPVREGTFRYSIYRTPFREDFLQSERTVFEDPAYTGQIEFVASEEHSVEEVLDENGEMTGNLTPSQYGLDRDYVFVIKAEVIDPSYAIATGSARVTVMQHEFVMRPRMGKAVYLPGEAVNVTNRLLYANGKPVVNQEIRYQAILEENSVTLAQGILHTDSNGTATISFVAAGKGFLRVLLTAEDRFQHQLQSNVYTWVGQDGGTFVYTSANLTVVCDKAQYQVGDVAKVLLVSPVPDADALIVSEREGIFEYRLKKFTGNSMLLDLPITSKLTPNFFLNALFVFNNQVYEQTVNIQVPPASKVLNVAVTTDKQTYIPREKGEIQVKVTDAEGNPVQAEVSLAVINEALYQLSPEIAPNLWLFFYSPRWDALAMHTSIALRFYGYSRSLRERFALGYYAKSLWDFEDFLHTGARYAGFKENKELIPRIFSDEERKLFQDQILWQGQLVTDANGLVVAPIAFPDNLTEWRVTAVAVTSDTRLGKATAQVKTEKNFFVRLNAPRHLSYVDRTEGYVTVVNNRDTARQVTLSLTFDQINGTFTPTTMMLPPRGEKTLAFPLTPDHVARAEIHAEAVSDAESDRLVQTIDILPVALPQMRSGVKIITDDSEAFTVTIPPAAIPETIHLKIGLSELDNPLGVVTEALPYLKEYPYGCAEQTTSSFLPNLMAFEAANTLGLELPKVFADREKILRTGLEKLYGLRNADGGWGWWNEDSSNVFMTAYVLYALSLADELYPDVVNPAIANQAVRALFSLLDANEGDEPSRIYAYYVLSRLGTFYEYMLDKLVANAPDSPFFLSFLILYGAHAGLDDNTIQTLAQRLDGLAQPDGPGVTWGAKNEYPWYGSDVVATSVAIRALLAANSSSENIAKGLLSLLLRREGNHWTSTRETAEAVYAISEYAAAQAKETQAHLPVDVLNGAENLGMMEFSDTTYKNTLDVPSASLAPGSTLTLRFGAKDQTYIGNFTLAYHTGETTIAPDDQGISVTRRYYRVPDKTTMTPLEEPLTVKAGDVLLVELKVNTAQPMEYGILEETLPAGCIPVLNVNEYNLDVSLFDDEMMAHYEFGHRNAAFFFNKLESGTYHYLVQAVYPGEYHVLPALGYGMYQPEKRGNSASAMLKIEK